MLKDEAQITPLTTALRDRYRIERELGAGGMATVYLAQDLKHDRKVAIKVLKPELAAILGAERFVQEIKTTAALAHPHILPLFDSGEADGFLYYVMPYIEGETVREKLNRETQFRIDEAVRITTEVADALDYAHRHGVIHRDIKPENILLHDGRPMVMDFGIALAVSAAAGGRMTETGLSLGTPHYMSPEQATADKTITARSDIYSLASVLYEMLAGVPPHEGGSAQQTIMRIVTEIPRPVSELRKSVPPNVAAAVHQALQKLPADRFATAAAFAAALGDPGFAGYGSAASFHQRSLRGRSRATMFGLGLVAFIAAVIAAWGWLRPRPVAPLARYATSLVADERRDGVELALETAISPRGGSIVFRQPLVGALKRYVPNAGEGQLYVKRQGELVAQPLAGTEGGTAPFFSPDGEWIGFFVARQLRKIPSAGGTSVVLADSVDIEYPGGAWLADGSIVYHDWPNLKRLPAQGGTPRVIAPLDKLDGHLPWLPSALPDARGVLFAACAVSGQSTCAQSQVFVYDAKRDSVHLLFKNASAAWYVARHIVYLTPNGTLYAVPWDNDALAPTGPPTRLLDGIQPPGFIVSADGMALYVLGPPLFGSGPAPNAELVWADRSGRVTPLDASWRFNLGNDYWGLDLSPDGRRLAISVRTDLGQDIWIKDLPSGQPSRITFYDGQDGAPTWSPDGRNITFISDRPTAGDSTRRGRLWEQAADGSGAAHLLASHDALYYGVRSPDGNWLVLATSNADRSGSGDDILIAKPDADRTPQPLVATRFDEVDPAVSPDSRWIAYVSNESGVFEVYVRPFPDAERAKWQVSRGTESAPVWSHDGKELYYMNHGAMTVVDIHPGPPFTSSPPRVLFKTPDGAIVDLKSRTFRITPDDQRFLMIRNVTPWDTTGTPRLVLVQNFGRQFEQQGGR